MKPSISTWHNRVTGYPGKFTVSGKDLRLKSVVGLLMIGLSVCMVNSINGQIGIQAQFHLPGLIGESAETPSPVIKNTWSAGIVYSIRNSEMRVEFLPGIAYISTSAISNSSESLRGQGLLAGMDVRVYPMDLYGDCMCPTFSRKGDVFKKGFFWEGGAGYSFLNQDLGIETSAGHSFFARLGLGLDIGLTRSLTFTPGLRMQYQHRWHHWGTTDKQIQHRPIWFLPFIQVMFYFED